MAGENPDGCVAGEIVGDESVSLQEPSRSNTPPDPHELDISLAAQVQQLLFPKVAPVCSWCCTGIRNRMADRIGGDYFDFMTTADGRQGVLIGDVTGHGIHASIVMSLIYGFVYRSIRHACSSSDLIRQVNDFLIFFAQRSETLDYLFTSTLFFGMIEPGTLQMEYVNAGHVPPMVRRGEEVILLLPTCQPVGFFPAELVEMSTFTFQDGDRFFLYTDGLPDTESPDGEPFGTGRLEEAVKRGESDYLVFLDELFMAVESFEGDGSPRDDCTAMVVDFHAGAGQVSSVEMS